MRLEEKALSDDYFIQRKLYPNVDFYTGLIYKAMGFPEKMFTVLFAIGRLPGWIAQWREMISDPQHQDRPPAPAVHRRTGAQLPVPVARQAPATGRLRQNDDARRRRPRTLLRCAAGVVLRAAPSRCDPRHAAARAPVCPPGRSDTDVLKKTSAQICRRRTSGARK